MGASTAAVEAAILEPQKRSYTHVTAPSRQVNTNWFELQPIPFTQRNTTYVNNIPACIISNMELEQEEKQFEYALILKFSAGRPSLFDIKNHIYNSWEMKSDPVITLLDARNVLLIAENQEDMIKAQTQPSRRINASLYRIFRWSRDFDFNKDDKIVPVWISLPRLPISYMNPTLLRKIGNMVGDFLRVDVKTLKLNNAFAARICVEVDVSQDLPQAIWVGDSPDNGFVQNLEYEGNNSFCGHCGLIGHGRGVCKKLRSQNEETKNAKHTSQVQSQKKPQTETWQIKKRGGRANDKEEIENTKNTLDNNHTDINQGRRNFNDNKNTEQQDNLESANPFSVLQEDHNEDSQSDLDKSNKHVINEEAAKDFDLVPETQEILRPDKTNNEENLIPVHTNLIPEKNNAENRDENKADESIEQNIQNSESPGTQEVLTLMNSLKQVEDQGQGQSKKVQSSQQPGRGGQQSYQQ
ncbi:hypothetical protein CASFOL_031702 [Castilleja foliolosa]|uniref:DUF4283 domain-containing protein n=1 Tax=Castilleja foliolosa TaxID=1961234 RepID=A0ABD3C621_9LAMI